ncbi:GntR family transcriptional regulator [Pseudooceanicola nanhaiensis]|uniref:GntR family transcriptional regulator n=1 Tax=Pseudooceanicola nanhaiensis TaxID=375761 RepID=UPI001CD7A750|nr:GntR family transcriptional regulator [Pseudooceanicola nanhaiensis]MCA0922331.1 GntR family transcriptional regulator [Pseudooceanicola nanhaiensis]
MPESRRNARQNHLALAMRILALVRERNMSPGDHLPEQSFSEACGVSRTPIRSAFKLLEEKGILSWREEEGFFLELGRDDGLDEAAQELESLEDSLAHRILTDRAARRIDDLQSVSALARRYSTSRTSVLNALKILSRDGIVTQMPGRSWAFQPILDTPNAADESLQFRLQLEPQAILTPGFRLDAQKSGLLRGQMQDALQSAAGSIGNAGFLRLDVEFHMLVAEGSANRFVRGALMAHQRLRKATQKDFSIPDFRLRQSLEEHLDILDALEQMQFDVAADLMTLHLRRSRRRRPEAANRGIPPLMRGPR